MSRARDLADSADLAFDGNTLKIDSTNNRVGIGTDSPNNPIHINGGAADTALQITNSATGSSATDGFSITVENPTPDVAIRNRESSDIKFLTANTERMRIDSSGNLLVGTTNTVPGIANTDEGISLRGTTGNSSSIAISRTSGVSAYFNRNSSDGSLVQFRKDGTTVGSISAYAGSIIVGSGDTGLFCYDAGDVIRPVSPTTLSTRDNIIDIGSSAARFKDLYLSGGVYLGGTGSANYLDDYEEGTWTSSPQVGTYSFNSPRYTKIGRMVHCHVQIGTISDTSSSNTFQVQLPFTPAASNNAATLGTLYQSVNRNPITGAYLNGGVLSLYIANTFAQLAHSDLNSGTSIYLSFTYMAAA